MITVSFNILYKDDNKTIVYTENPYVYNSDNISDIIFEIREIIKSDFNSIANYIEVPVEYLSFGITIISNNIVHLFHIKGCNIREIQNIMKGC